MSRALAFRFAVIYFTLYIFLSQMFTSLLFPATHDLNTFDMDELPPVRAAVAWVAAHGFRIGHALWMGKPGSDRVFDWVELACVFGLAAVGAAVWSWLDRRRRAYPRLAAWFRVFLRMALAATFFSYGVSKAIALQMPYPNLARLIEPLGDYSPYSLLWASVGVAPAYEIFTGVAEMLAGALLIVPATATLGALIALADAIQVLMLNLAYDVPVKLLTFHLILIALLLLAPEARRLVDGLALRRATSAARDTPLFRQEAFRRWAFAAQLGIGVFLVAANFYNDVGLKVAAARLHSPLYGIWSTTSFQMDGEERQPRSDDAERWQYAIFDSSERVLVQGMDGSQTYYRTRFDASTGQLEMWLAGDTSWRGTLAVARPSPGRLKLSGDLEGHELQVGLDLVPLSHFVLVSRGFHLVQDRPYAH